MDNKKYNISVPRMGMNKSTDYRNLESTEYTHASNVNLESVDGDFIDATYEKSNILEVNFPNGYKVVGRVNRLSNNYTYLFLHNPITNKNIFGYIDNNKKYIDREDIGEVLQPPLETTIQTPYNTFFTLIDDSCLDSDKGFNFHIDYPLMNIVIKEEKTGAEIYFTDFRNPARYIELDNIQKYFTEEVPCGNDIPTLCPNIDIMRVHTLYKFPTITNVTLNNGGALGKGSYIFLVALTDSEGNEISEYTSITQPIDVWEQSTIDVTNKAIRVTIESLDENFSHYKIVVLYRQHLDAVSTPYEVGVYSSSVKEVVVSSLDYSQRTSLEKLSFQNQKVIKSEGLTVVNNSLLEYGLVFEKEINLQPVVNLMGSYLQWQTHITTEDIYNKGDYRSKYLGINRNEIVPYSIRFLIEGGITTPVFPLVGREATNMEKSVVPVSNKDRQSIEGTLDCSVSNRIYNWQYYNTATVTYTQEGTSTTDVQFEEFVYCTNEDVNTIEGGTYTFSEDEAFYDLTTYIQQNIVNCSGKLPEMEVCTALNEAYDVSCIIEEDLECGTPEKIKSENYIASINGEVVEPALDTNYSKYQPTFPSPPVLNPYKQPYNKNEYGLYERNTDGVLNFGSRQSAFQIQNSSQTNYITGDVIFDCVDEDVVLNSVFTSSGSLAGGLFKENITTVARWFKLTNTLNVSVFIGKEVNALLESDNFPNDETFVFSKTRRVSFFNSTSNDAVYSFNYSADNGTKFLVYREGNNIYIKTSDQTVLLGSSQEIFFTVENPITTLGSGKCIVQPSYGGYTVYNTALENSGTRVTYDSITIGTKITYKKTCTRNEAVLGNCDIQPFQRGEFSYWESEITYPDNQTLFDSTKLVIKEETLRPNLKTDFLNKFTNGTYKIKESFNLACKPIRHFKFPDNKVSPFMTYQPAIPLNDAQIYPLGVTINEEAINMLLDIAVDSDLISKGTRENIYGYEIFRGDLSVSRSIFSSGLLYDLRSYQEDNKTVYYSNYPYNTYRDDVLNQIPKTSNFGVSNSKYTFHSPETDYSTNNAIPIEINVQGYQFGSSSGYFDDVEDHPKWTILSRKAYRTAETLATLEVIGESLIEAARLTSQVPGIWIVGGIGSSGTNAGGYAVQIGLSIAAGAVVLAQGYLYNYGKYRNQWQETFRNLGRGSNFASYYFSKGDYNYMLPIQEQGNSVRSLQAVKNIKDGRYEINNRVSKNNTSVNNLDREWSVYMDLGETNQIVYPNQYSSYDTKSLTFLSENGQNKSGRSAELVSNIASPYVQIVNYNPTLHGAINSVVWLNTSYRGDLRNPKTTILPIFGGDTYISRHTLKRKIPLFLTTAMGQSMTTPFEYKFYNNIGTNPRFYINYNISSEFTSRSNFIPEITSELAVDNRTEEGFYIVNPSKFYLYYYGIPSFLTETRINTNYRESGRTPQDNFYPEVGDIGRWTQENTVSIREPNFFKYSNTYSNQTPQFNSRVLGANYTQGLQDKVEKTYNAVITSLPDVNENSKINPWLRFRPLDFYEFESKFGKLTELKGIENEAILARFEDTSIIYNKVDTKVDDGNTSSAFLGGTSIFQRRTTSFVNSELGFGGSKHKESLSCEFGHFYADLDRGQIIQIPSGGGNMIEISNINQFGKSTNMKDWFKRNLPLKLLKSNIEGIENLNIDNPYNKVGITFGYDSLHKRILITKKDYIPVSDCPIFYNENDGLFTTECEPPTISCEKGYTLDPITNMCVRETITPLCPEGYTFNSVTQLCEPSGTPQPINYDGADVVFILHAGATESETYTNIRNSVLSAISTGVFENSFDNNVRFAVIKTNFLKNKRTKYLTLGGFNTPKQQTLTQLNNTPADYYETNPVLIDQNYFVSPGLYSPVDLAVEAALLNIPERTFNNTVLGSNSIGEFRSGNIAKIVYVIGEINTGMGHLVLGNGIGTSNYSPYNNGGCQEGAEFAVYLNELAQEQGVQIFPISTSLIDILDGSYPTPTPENDYKYYKKWFEKTIMTSDCNYYFTRLGVAGFERIQESISEIILPNCREDIKPNCGCSVVPPNCVCIDYKSPIISQNKVKISLDDPNYFKEVSWTITYNPQFGMFTSFQDYLPNYYINHFDYFSSGRNTTENLWSHNVTNKSFGVYYGNKHPMEIEVLTKATDGSYLGTVSLFTEAKRYYDNQDFHINTDLTFNRSIIYNKRHCSGLLNLDLVTGGTRFLSRYPITVSETEQAIPITKTENRFNYSYFYDRRIRDKNLPFIKNDENQIKIEVDNVSFTQKLNGKQLPRIFGDFYLNRLYYDTDSRFAMTIKLQKSLTNLYMSE